MTQHWTANDVAEIWGIAPATVRAYASRGQMPEPDGRTGSTDWWLPATIEAWERPGRGRKRTQPGVFELAPPHPDDNSRLQHHMTALGLSKILHHKVGQHAVSCSEHGTYQLGRTPGEVARAIWEHAVEQCEVPWDQRSPRATGPTLLGPQLRPVPKSPQQTRQQWALRTQTLAGLDDLTRALVAGLGFPATLVRADVLVASGRSWWDVTDRRRGDEIGSTRLAPLARHIAALSEDEILARITRPLTNAEADTFAPTWTSMRWQHNPADPVRVWCSIWALAALPVAPTITTLDDEPIIWWSTPGAGQQANGGRFLALPLPVESTVTSTLWADTVGHPAITRAAAHLGTNQVSLPDLLWAADQGFTVVARWDVRTARGTHVTDRFVDDPFTVDRGRRHQQFRLT